MSAVEWGNVGVFALLRNIVHQMKEVAIAVLGDPMLDYYHFGHVDRLSPEAPVPVFIEDKIDLRDGGAGNVVANLAGLGCQVLSIFPPAPYSMKHRYLVGSQQLFRVDNDRDHSRQLHQSWADLSHVHALVISDYGKGWCSDERCAGYIATAREWKIPVIVDPKGTDWGKYSGATVICPNEREIVRNYDAFAEYIVHKKGAGGLTVYQPTAVSHHFDACARHVFDVTGAGDTVTAVLAAALALRCEIEVAAQLANIAAGVVVGEVGTTAITAAVLLRELEG